MLTREEWIFKAINRKILYNGELKELERLEKLYLGEKKISITQLQWLERRFKQSLNKELGITEEAWEE